MSDKTYNGWKNYETWNVSLWLNNDEGYYNQVREDVRSLQNYPGWNAKDAAYRIGQRIEEYVRGIFDEFGEFGDLREGRSINQVDWSEVGAAWIED